MQSTSPTLASPTWFCPDCAIYVTVIGDYKRFAAIMRPDSFAATRKWALFNAP